jgi:predicted phage replisome organizer
MANKKFYWIKLKTDFFNREDIDFLLSQTNGCQYVVLYQMLCLSTANNDGKLETRIGEVIVPFNAEKVVRDCKYFDIDTVNVAMSLYRKMGLIYEQEDGTLRISKYEEMVGSETSSAKAMREWRSKKKLLQCDNNVIQEKDNRDQITENREEDKEKDSEIEIINDKSLTTKQLNNEFEYLWKLYPRKNSKKDALRHYIVARKKGANYDDVLNGLYAYLDYIKDQKIETQFIKHGSTWFNQECWNDEYLVINPNRTLKDISMAEIDEALRLERERSGKH